MLFFQMMTNFEILQKIPTLCCFPKEWCMGFVEILRNFRRAQQTIRAEEFVETDSVLHPKD